MVMLTLGQTGWKVYGEALYYFFYTSSAGLYGEGNGTSLQYSCLENPMDGEAW